jgi:hypothetical protein
MAEAQYSFSYKEIVEMLVRRAGVTEGLWGFYVRFGLNAGNVGPDEQNLTPAAIVGLAEVGIQKVDKLTNLSVDAAEVAKRALAEKK